MRTIITMLGLLLLSIPVIAQDALTVGDTINATTNNTDVDYTLDLLEGEEVTITLESEDFDTFLAILDSEGTNLVSNDDAEGLGRNSQLTFIAPAEDTYTVRVESFFGAADGNYTLTVTGDGDLTPAELDADFVLGESIEGVADNAQPTYDIALTAGQEVTFTLESADFDTYLELYDNETRLAANDDISETNLNSQIVVTPEEDKIYTLVVRTFSGDATGEFMLSAQAGSTAAIAPENTTGYAIQETLAGDGQESLSYFFDGTEGDVVSIYAIAANDDDTALQLYSPSGQLLLEDDNNGEGNNPALLRVQLPKTGEYEVVILEQNGGAINDDITLIIEDSVLLNPADAPVTFPLAGDFPNEEVITLDFERGNTYRIAITPDDALESTLFYDMQVPGREFATIRGSISGSSGISFLFESDVTVRATLNIRHYVFPGPVNFTIEMETLTPTPEEE